MPDFCLKGGKVLRSIEIPYGRGRQIFRIEDHRLTGVLMPETMPKAGEETEIVRRAISAPIETHFQFGKSGSDYMRLVHPAGVEPVAFRVRVARMGF